VSKISRRHFLYGTVLAGAIPRGGFGSVTSLKALGYQSPNEKLNVAVIGVGGRGQSALSGCDTENIVALADADWARAAQSFERYPKATRHKDFRRMLDRDGKLIDAVAVATPDHTHAVAALAAMQLGKGVYVEKPLVRTPWEARLLADAARKYKVATQMGNQGYSHEATRVANEIIWSGEIGEVREVHAWRGRASWPQGAAMQTVPAPEPVPDTLDWDVWLGPAAMRPFTRGGDAYKGAENGFYLPFNWRGHTDFGTGGLIGDWGIHILGPANWALRLGSPTSVECVKQEGTSPFAIPDRMHIRWEFPARGSMPPVTLHWYVDYNNAQGDAYTPPGMTAEQARQIPGTGPAIANPPGARAGGAGGRGGAAQAAAGRGGDAAEAAAGGRGGRGRAGGGNQPQGSGYNQIFVGSKGYLGTNGRGEGVGLIPGSRWAEYSLPAPTLTRSPGHHRDWIRACKGGEPSCSNFNIAGPYTEWVTLGAIALRVPGKLMWNGAKMEFTNNAEANKYVKPFQRKGWEMKL
jgi:predicted dehydrogenase